jgi:hypothetical protein
MRGDERPTQHQSQDELKPGGTRGGHGVLRGPYPSSRARHRAGLCWGSRVGSQSAPPRVTTSSRDSQERTRGMNPIPVHGSGAQAGIEPALTAYRQPEGRLHESGTSSAHLCTRSSDVTLASSGPVLRRLKHRALDTRRVSIRRRSASSDPGKYPAGGRRRSNGPPRYAARSTSPSRGAHPGQVLVRHGPH